MKVVIIINDHGNEYCWNDLTKEQQQLYVEKLNNQTAKALGYEQITK